MDVSFLVIPITVGAFICIRKGVQTQSVLIALGLLLIFLADFLSPHSSVSLPGIVLKFIDETIPTYFSIVFSGSALQLSLVVMAIGGYAREMTHIGSAGATMDMLYRMLPPHAPVMFDSRCSSFLLIEALVSTMTIILDKGIKARLADLDEFFKEFKPFHRNTVV